MNSIFNALGADPDRKFMSVQYRPRARTNDEYLVKSNLYPSVIFDSNRKNKEDKES